MITTINKNLFLLQDFLNNEINKFTDYNLLMDIDNDEGLGELHRILTSNLDDKRGFVKLNENNIKVRVEYVFRNIFIESNNSKNRDVVKELVFKVYFVQGVYFANESPIIFEPSTTASYANIFIFEEMISDMFTDSRCLVDENGNFHEPYDDIELRKIRNQITVQDALLYFINMIEPAFYPLGFDSKMAFGDIERVIRTLMIYKTFRNANDILTEDQIDLSILRIAMTKYFDNLSHNVLSTNCINKEKYMSILTDKNVPNDSIVFTNILKDKESKEKTKKELLKFKVNYLLYLKKIKQYLYNDINNVKPFYVYNRMVFDQIKYEDTMYI